MSHQRTLTPVRVTNFHIFYFIRLQIVAVRPAATTLSSVSLTLTSVVTDCESLTLNLLEHLLIYLGTMHVPCEHSSKPREVGRNYLNNRVGTR